MKQEGMHDLTTPSELLEEILKHYTFHHSHCFPPTDYPEGKCLCGLDDLSTKLRAYLAPYKDKHYAKPKASPKPI